jgi:hypothetical protein
MAVNRLSSFYRILPQPIILMAFLGLLDGYFVMIYQLLKLMFNDIEQVDLCDRLNAKDGLLFVAHCRV